MDPEDPTDLEEEDTTPDEVGEEFEPGGFERWRRESAVGSVGTSIARSLQNVFAPPPNQPAIVASVPGDPPDPERLQVILDPDDPTKSVVHLPRARDAGDDDPPA